MTGAPIYLVSACSSGEEFVAAFRRYADKSGLFIPMSEPLPAGRRARFAVTLRDGGVMIEGDAEVITSARTASVLHGRIGMTLRFLEPDEASKTTLGELERARLAMKPAPPSIPPRPAEIPSQPRPIPPPVHGRVDAVNALAQCVAIGDPEPAPAPVVAPPPVVVPPPKAGPRFVSPSSAGGTRVGPPITPTETGVGVAPRPLPRIPSGPTSDTYIAVTPPAPAGLAGPSTSPRHAAEMPVAIPRPITMPGTGAPIAVSRTPTRPGAAPPPAATPTPPPRPAAAPTATSSAASSAAPSGASSAAPSAVPSGAPTGMPREDTISETLTAVPIPSATPASAPTEVGGVLVELLPPVDSAVAETAPSDDASARTQVRGGAPSPERAPVVTPDATTDATPDATTHAAPEATTRAAPEATTDAAAGGATRAALGAAAPAALQRSPEASPEPLIETLDDDEDPDRSPSAQGPAPPIVAGAPPSVPEIEIAEPTDISLGPPEPLPDMHRRETRELPPPQTIELPAPDAIALQPPDADEPTPSDETPRPRKTALGFAAVPSRILPPVPVSPPATSSASGASDASSASSASTGSGQVTAVIAAASPDEADASLRASEETTGNDQVTVAPGPGDATSPTLAPEPRLQPAIDELTPSDGWSMPPDHAMWPTASLAAERPPATRETLSLRKVAPPSDALPPSGTLPPSPTLPPSETLPPRAMRSANDARVTETLPPSAVPPPRASSSVAPEQARSAAASAGPSPVDGPALPSGDWLIARDPSAPDGWSEPFHTVTPHRFTQVPPLAPAPVVAVPPPVVAEPPPVDAAPKQPSPDGSGDGDATAEPKVQIDPTLVESVPVQLIPMPLQTLPPTPMAMQTPPPETMPLEPRLRPMPPDGPPHAAPPDNPFLDAPVSSPTMPEYGAAPAQAAIQAAIEAPPMNMRVAVAQSSPYLMQQGRAAMPIGPTPVYAAGTDYAGPIAHDARYDSDAAMRRARAGNRRVIIVLLSALVAALIGIAALLALGDDSDTAPGRRATPRGPRSAEPAKPPSPAPAQPKRASEPLLAPAVPATPPAPGSAAPPAVETTGATTPPSTSECFADVSSVPAGAEIVIDQSYVIGVTPTKLPLPCGRPVELTIRKGRLAAAPRTITPTPKGAKLRVTLTRPTFQVKVSSTPPGATITLNGKPLGVTPTTVKVPGFESSVLKITKDGYAAESETVAPKSNGLAVHAELKRTDRKKPW